ncbi:MAG: DUF3467 domain-containing protein [Planctomycetota bacterium]|nr:DUF3467 domain-containing protein [Planctomycetota bacterium]
MPVPKKMTTSSEAFTKEALEVRAEPALLRGVFSNYALVSHTPHDFMINFCVQYDGDTHLTARVMMTPMQIRRLSKAIEGNIEKYEERFGEIEEKAPAQHATTKKIGHKKKTKAKKKTKGQRIKKSAKK